MKTIVLGASPNPTRMSHTAVLRLQDEGFEVVPVGIRNGEIGKLSIRIDQPILEDIHTISMYISPEKQPPLYEYVLKLNPKRIIFNPGSENIELKRLAESNGIQTEYACTLVMLSLGNYDAQIAG